MLGNEPKILDFKFEDGTALSLWINQQVRKTESAPKKCQRPKIKILIKLSGFRSNRGLTCQISWSCEFKFRRFCSANYVNKQTNTRYWRKILLLYRLAFSQFFINKSSANAPIMADWSSNIWQYLRKRDYTGLHLGKGTTCRTEVNLGY